MLKLQNFVGKKFWKSKWTCKAKVKLGGKALNRVKKWNQNFMLFHKI